jgi:hypothetical protein
MSGCPDCTAAAERDWHGFVNGCRGCCARAAARSPHFRRVRDAGAQDRAYRQLLEQFALSHEDVKAAAAVDALGKEPA